MENINPDTMMELLVNFHKDAERQGPGCEDVTVKALQYIEGHEKFSAILDIGCGTGAQTITLANHTQAKIIAVDAFSEFIEKLRERAVKAGVGDRITGLAMPMDMLNLPEHGFDLVWAEGSIYITGFEKGLKYWKKFIKPGGWLAVSEISWLTKNRPIEIHEYWMTAYPQIAQVDEKLKTIQKCGYIPAAHFAFPENCWTEHYYEPIVKRVEAFGEQFKSMPESQEFIRAELEEIEMYKKYKEYYSYVFYIMRNM
jgi:ubiquinone/menaquinone biosynthesis C-methylase UbiE